MSEQPSEFYIGYTEQIPPKTKSLLKRFVLLCLIAAIDTSVLFAIFQNKLDRGSFDFTSTKTYEGVLIADPLPILRSEGKTYLLVGDGKFGAKKWVDKWSEVTKGNTVKLQAKLIERAPLSMLEIDRKSEPEIIHSSLKQENLMSTIQTEVLGEMDLEGELVDSKCYLGVMRPAMGKVHKACAIRCLSGGVPPGILLRNPNIDTSVLVLIGSGDNSTQIRVPPEWAARTVRAHGILEIKDGIPVLLPQKIELAP